MGPYFCGVQPIFAGKNGIAVAQPEYSVSWPKSLFSKPRAARARKYSLNLNGQSERLVPHTTANQCFAQFLRWVFQLSPSPSNFHSIRQWPFEWQSRDLSKGFLTSMREPRISVNRRCLWSRRCRWSRYCAKSYESDQIVPLNWAFTMKTWQSAIHRTEWVAMNRLCNHTGGKV